MDGGQTRAFLHLPTLRARLQDCAAFRPVKAFNFGLWNLRVRDMVGQSIGNFNQSEATHGSLKTYSSAS